MDDHFSGGTKKITDNHRVLEPKSDHVILEQPQSTIITYYMTCAIKILALKLSIPEKSRKGHVLGGYASKKFNWLKTKVSLCFPAIQGTVRSSSW